MTIIQNQADAEQAPAFPAAALILMADSDDGAPPRLLFVRRASTLRFAGGAFAFPGGRVDRADQDEALSRTPAGADGLEAASRVAALRELAEETGVALVGSDAGLIPFARWRPGPDVAVARRFDTRFYLARTASMPEPVADGQEIDRAFWASAAELLERSRSGEGRLLYPTRRLLERLARFGGFDQARAEAERLPQRLISPWVEHDADGAWLCIPEGAGYPVTRERIGETPRG